LEFRRVLFRSSNKPCQPAADWTASTAFFASTLAGGEAELVAGLDGLASVVAVGTGESDANFPDLSNGVGVAQPPRVASAATRMTTGRAKCSSGAPAVPAKSKNRFIDI